MVEIIDDDDWLCSFMGGLDIIETNIIPKSIKYPEIDTSYVFRPFTRHPKLIRAVIEEQPTPKPTKNT